jgi:hypothetical protein
MNNGLQFDIFTGRTTALEAQVYVRWNGGEWAQPGVIRGSVTGPFCEYARTLPATTSLEYLGRSPVPLARAVVPDPCPWTPELPYLYHVRADTGAAQPFERMIGIRRFGPHGRSLFLDGRRTVLRGLAATALTSLPTLANWHASDMAMLIAEPDASLCREASRLGVFLVADLTSLPVDVQFTQVHALAVYPAVALMAVTLPQEADVGKLIPGAWLAAWFRGGRFVPARWPHVVLWDVDNNHEHDQNRGHKSQASNHGAADHDWAAAAAYPIVACRSAGSFASLPEARKACDLLQRDLAPRLDLAGYFVT